MADDGDDGLTAVGLVVASSKICRHPRKGLCVAPSRASRASPLRNHNAISYGVRAPHLICASSHINRSARWRPGLFHEGLPVDVNTPSACVASPPPPAAASLRQADKMPEHGELCERWTPDEDQRLLEAVAEFGNAFASISRETFGGRAGRSRHACRNRFQLLQGARNNRNGKMAPAAASAIVSHSTQLEAARETLKVNKEAKAERKQQRHSSYRGGSSSAAYTSNRAAPRRAAAAKAARWAMEEEDDDEEERLYDMSEVDEEEEMVEAAAEVAVPTHVASPPQQTPPKLYRSLLLLLLPSLPVSLQRESASRKRRRRRRIAARLQPRSRHGCCSSMNCLQRSASGAWIYRDRRL